MNSADTDLCVDLRHDAGFTLTEMLVVLLIIALATGTASIMILRGSREIGAVQLGLELQQFFAQAHEKALISGRTKTVQFDTQRRVFMMEGDARRLAVPQDISFNITVGQELVRPDASVSIHFFGQGGSTGASFELSDTKGEKAVVQANWLTGISVVERSEHARF